MIFETETKGLVLGQSCETKVRLPIRELVLMYAGPHKMVFQNKTQLVISSHGRYLVLTEKHRTSNFFDSLDTM